MGADGLRAVGLDVAPQVAYLHGRESFHEAPGIFEARRHDRRTVFVQKAPALRRGKRRAPFGKITGPLDGEAGLEHDLARLIHIHPAFGGLDGGATLRKGAGVAVAWGDGVRAVFVHEAPQPVFADGSQPFRERLGHVEGRRDDLAAVRIHEAPLPGGGADGGAAISKAAHGGVEGGHGQRAARVHEAPQVAYLHGSTAFVEIACGVVVGRDGNATLRVGVAPETLHADGIEEVRRVVGRAVAGGERVAGGSQGDEQEERKRAEHGCYGTTVSGQVRVPEGVSSRAK